MTITEQMKLIPVTKHEMRMIKASRKKRAKIKQIKIKRRGL